MFVKYICVLCYSLIQVLKLRLWKMQLIDEEHLLIKFASEEVVTLLAAEPNSMPAFFVIYNLKTTEVI